MEKKKKGDKWCIHGKWKDGVCVCDPGKATFFNDKLLVQKYCDMDEVAAARLRVSYPPKHFLYLSTMSFTVILSVVGFLLLAGALAIILLKCRTARNIKTAYQELVQFKDERVMRNTDDLQVTFWAPPTEFVCINQQSSGDSLEAKVVVAYNPQTDGELTLKPGQTVVHVEMLQRGWCRGSVGGKTGLFPAAFVEILHM